MARIGAHAHWPAHGRIARRRDAERLLPLGRPSAASAPYYIDHK
jgi:hypothetical protein